MTDSIQSEPEIVCTELSDSSWPTGVNHRPHLIDRFRCKADFQPGRVTSIKTALDHHIYALFNRHQQTQQFRLDSVSPTANQQFNRGQSTAIGTFLLKTVSKRRIRFKSGFDKKSSRADSWNGCFKHPSTTAKQQARPTFTG